MGLKPQDRVDVEIYVANYQKTYTSIWAAYVCLHNYKTKTYKATPANKQIDLVTSLLDFKYNVHF